MKINYDVEIPMSEAEDINELHKFAHSDKKNMKITYDSVKEAISRRSVLARAIETNEFAMNIKRVGADVYIEVK